MGDAYDAMDAGRVPTKGEVERELARVRAELERERTQNRELREALTDLCDTIDTQGRTEAPNLISVAIGNEVGRSRRLLLRGAALSTQEESK